jgi:hypothetical protein
MAFPVSPTEGQTYTENNTVWIYSAVTGQWNRSVINPLNETLYVFGSASATGAAGEIQYTDGSRLAASPNLVWDDVNDELEVGGDVVLDDGGTFTTTLQTVTPTQNRTISFPNATGTVGLVAGSSGQLVYNNAGAYAGVPSSVIGATGDVTLALNGAASTPPLELTGTWFTGGGATATKPQLLIEPAGTTSNAWSPDGTGLGVNAASTFTGRLLDLQRTGTSRVVVTGAGNVGIGTTSPASALHVNSGSTTAIINEGGNYSSFDSYVGGVRKAFFQWSNPDNAVIIDAQPANSSLRLLTADIERARIDSSGRLLVGTPSGRSYGGAGGASLLTIEGAGTTSTLGSATIVANNDNVLGGTIALGKSRGTVVGSSTIVQNGDRLGEIYFLGADGVDMDSYAAIIKCEVDGTPGSNDMPGRLVFSTTADGAANPTERMRINNAGTHVFGGGTAESNGTITLYPNNSNGAGLLAWSRAGTTNTSTALVFRDGGVAVGTITYTNTATAYNTSSDYRLKENVVPLTGAIDRVNDLQVHRFNFIADPDKTVDGFIAHEAQAVVPECVTGEKDAVDDDGNPVYQGIDQSKLVPLLTAALQEAIGEIESLKARVAALEGA